MMIEWIILFVICYWSFVTGHHLNPITKSQESGALIILLIYWFQKAVEQTVELSDIWDAMPLSWCQCNTWCITEELSWDGKLTYSCKKKHKGRKKIIRLFWFHCLVIPWLIETEWRIYAICVSKLTVICWDNGLSPGRRQAIIWTNAGKLLIRTLATNLSGILSEIRAVSWKKQYLKMSSAKWRHFDPASICYRRMRNQPDNDHVHLLEFHGLHVKVYVDIAHQLITNPHVSNFINALKRFDIISVNQCQTPNFNSETLVVYKKIKCTYN